jgi:hypothetical protein
MSRNAIALVVFSLVIGSLAGCGGTNDPFSSVKEKGKVTYTDGSLIPAFRISILFVSEAPPADSKTSPPTGVAEVNVADGTYDHVTSYKSDGVVRGKLKVLIRCMDNKDRPIKVVADEYLDKNKTPLEADTENPESFNFTVKKYAGPTAGPTGTAVPGNQGHQGARGNR